MLQLALPCILLWTTSYCCYISAFTKNKKNINKWKSMQHRLSYPLYQTPETPGPTFPIRQLPVWPHLLNSVHQFYFIDLFSWGQNTVYSKGKTNTHIFFYSPTFISLKKSMSSRFSGYFPWIFAVSFLMNKYENWSVLQKRQSRIFFTKCCFKVDKWNKTTLPRQKY